MRRALLLLLLCSASLAGCSSVFFQPMRGHVITPERIGLAYQDVYFNAADGVRLHGWFIPAQGAATGTVFFLHGNAENISTHIGSVYWLPKQGFNVFLPDYRGYGLSQGTPTLDGVMSDIAAAFDTLLARLDVDPQRIVVFGQSLGGSLAISYVAQSPHRAHIRALAVESAFSDFHGIAREKLASFWLTWPFQWLPALMLDNGHSPLRAVDKVAPIPLLVIHGELDLIIPAQHGRDLYGRARDPKELWIVPDAGHIEALRTFQNRERFVAWLRKQLGAQPSSRAPAVPVASARDIPPAAVRPHQAGQRARLWSRRSGAALTD
jgi:fermentation-respiration switch protein FrsA (DUF1100 family)